jgi:hypothetical protein
MEPFTTAFGIRPGLNNNLLAFGTDGIIQDRVADTGRIENQITGFRALLEHFRVQLLAKLKFVRFPRDNCFCALRVTSIERRSY